MGADHDGGRAAGAKGAATEETRKGLRLRILPGTGCHRAGPPSKSGARAGGGRSDDFTQSNCGGTEAELATSATTCLHPQPPSRAYICVRNLFFRRRLGDQDNDLWYLEKSDDGSSYKEVLFLQSRFNETTAKFSPDGRYVAYSADESGEYEVYIRRFPDAGGLRRVSANGGSQPRWRADGKELFYVEGDRLMAVPVSTSPELTVGTPKLLFSSPGLLLNGDRVLNYDVTPDGQRFVVWEPIEAEEEVQQSIRVVQNWFAEFKDGQTEP